MHDGSEYNACDVEENRINRKVGDGDDPKMAAPEVTQILHHIYTRLDFLSQIMGSKVETKSEDDLVKSEWRSVAMVLDRVFFCCFLTLTVGTIITIFMRIP